MLLCVCLVFVFVFTVFSYWILDNFFKLINGEIYIDSMIYYAVRMNLKVSAIIDDTYVNMGTPKLLKEFNYWNKYFNE